MQRLYMQKCANKFIDKWKNGRRCIKCGLIRPINKFRILNASKIIPYTTFASFCTFCRRRHHNLKGEKIGNEKIAYSRLQYKK